MNDLLDRIEVGNTLLWSWFPEVFKYNRVTWGDGMLATEYGISWLGVRVSLYGNIAERQSYKDA